MHPLGQCLPRAAICCCCKQAEKTSDHPNRYWGCVMFIDSFSSGIDELTGKRRTKENVLRILHTKGRFSCFEASANDWTARTVTALLKGPLVETYTPDEYKGQTEVDSVGPDRDTYPWTYVRLTQSGLDLIGEPSP